MANDVDSPETPAVDEGTGDIAKWAEQLSVETHTGPAHPEEETEETPPAKDGKEGADPATQGKPVLMAKDGVHTLPYSRLEESNAARDQAKAEAEAAKKAAEETAQQLAEARAQLEALQKQEKAGTATPAAVSQSADELEASIAAIEKSADELQDESPWLAEQQRASAKVMRGILASNRALEQRLAQEKQDAEARTQADVKAAEEAELTKVRAAIAAAPALSYWQASKPAFFAEAANIDKDLREKPEWAAKPYADRFKEVTRQMVAQYGESILPPGSGKKPPAVPKTDKQLLDDSVGLHTLTDLPGGAPTAQNPLDAITDANPSDLAAALLQKDMNPQDIIRWATG